MILLSEAQKAIKAGQHQKAQQLLRQAVRQNPQDHRAWLYLASITTTPEKSLAYIQRAEMLQPHDPMVHKALAWAEGRLQSPPPPPPTTPSSPPSWPKIALWGSLIGIVIMLLAIAALFTWRTINSDVVLAQAQTITTPIPAITQDNIVAIIPFTAVPTATPTPTSPPRLAKNINPNSQQARATWTLTPTPTNTPTPTPTYRPTYISPGNRKPSGRPLGVGENERWIDVDLSQQLLAAYQGNQLVYETYISSGTYDHPTVTGQFRIWLTYQSQTMDGRLLGYDYFLEDVPYVMYFYEDYALHGTYWHNNFGTPMSHGCVNLHTADAQWVFNWAGVGTLVNVHY